MQDPDTLLAAALRDWVASLPDGTAILSRIAPAKGGGAGYEVVPSRSGAAPICLRVAGGPEYFTLEVGRFARFEELPLSVEGVGKMCASVACGGFLEERWQLGGLTLARRASLIVGGDSTLRWGTQSPLFPVPFAHWVRHAPEPWLG